VWPDNETRIDLLGLDYLVDSLEVVLTEPRLLPVTVGVLGDWGSGKTSLLHMVADRLTDDYVVVLFSPWRYEAYEDVKAALMESALTKLEARVPAAEDPVAAAGLMKRLRYKVARLMHGPAAAGRVMAPVAGGLVAAHYGLPAELGKAAGGALVAGADAIQAGTETPAPPEEPSQVFESVSDFREEFEALVNGLPEVKAVVVLVDDLDRCLDDTVIDLTGTQRAAYTYDPYGSHHTATGINGTLPVNPWRYTGGYLDTTTGLYHNGARYYQPAFGRFTQQDNIVTIGNPANGNRYAYTGGDPINHTDPSSHDWWDPTTWSFPSYFEVGGCVGDGLAWCAGARFNSDGLSVGGGFGLGAGATADLTYNSGSPDGPSLGLQGCVPFDEALNAVCGQASTGSPGNSFGGGLGEGAGFFFTGGYFQHVF
jgi:RHS repeat-associated protein